MEDNHGPPSRRRKEAGEVKKRLGAMPGPDEVSDEERRLALELRALRVEASQSFGQIEVCTSCVRACDPPWEGGDCCSGKTHDRFTEAELASLRASGASPRRIKHPGGPLNGCAFRGVKGCSLEPTHRPSVCLSYICRELEHELHHKGRLPVISGLSQRIAATHERFMAARDERLAQEQDAMLLELFERDLRRR